MYPSDSAQNEKLPDSDAQRWCSEGFVVEKIRALPRPVLADLAKDLVRKREADE